MTQYKILSADDAQDERAPNVHLIYTYEDTEKTTAEDCFDYWMIRDWELHDHGETKMWFERSGYSISKATVGKLMELSKPTGENNE